ncbi:hypothetical protein N656DRAFT_609436 [Canariomyces notabilis]|uniref:Zinc knuckle-domain-containing protein n=1 Tax=Canariomyces notabilis TaxID=2074819 RepID=A0AAN6YU81_9PEZI|nr:hypothetical protein N656DRAFT_609436 [Canariomyces arenarius]
MYPYRGRTGPSKATPSNVQCQKCLKRGHYSYECKAAPQERPYIPRPSRTQQLFNPKLLPKLSNEVPDALEKKEGATDRELARREAERARKREREKDEESSPSASPPARRRRSPSYDSVSSISTRSPSPVPRRSPSPPRRARRKYSRSPSPASPQIAQRSFTSGDRYSREPSGDPRQDFSVRASRHPHSPSDRSPSPRRSLSPPSERGSDREYGRGRRGHSTSRSRSRSKSPIGRYDRRDRHGPGRYRDRDEHGRQEGRKSPARQPSPSRERSLSPFSKRLALTRTMNMGR